MAKRIKAATAREVARERSKHTRNRLAVEKPGSLTKNHSNPDVLDDSDVQTKRKAPSGVQMEKVKEAAREQVKLVRKIDKLEGELSDLTHKLDVNKLQLLPEAMKKAGMDRFDLSGGYGVVVRNLVFANVPQPDGRADNAAERHAKGVAYLDEHAPDLVKHSVIFYFKRGEEEKMFRKFVADVEKRKNPPTFVIKDIVDPRSLAAWVKKQDEAALSVDDAVLGVHRVVSAEVTIPKEKKKGIAI